MMPRPMIAGLVLIAGAAAVHATGDDPAEPPLERRFREVVHPFVREYCLGCHNAKTQQGKLDLSGYPSAAAVVKNHRVWDARPGAARGRGDAAGEGQEAADAARASGRRRVDRRAPRARGRRNAGDPGPVLARRLSNAEFDYTIRDLTGVDIRPTREFPVDPANEAGFDNSGESLAMSPALVKKYLAAARVVADHLVLKPEDSTSPRTRSVTDTDRDKYCVQRIIEFYERQRVDYADYFLAAWRYRKRAALGQPDASLAHIARRDA